MAQIHLKTIATLIGVVLFIGTVSSTVDDTQEVTTPPSNRIIQFREANYSEWNEKIKYNSTAMSNPKGMAPLYNLTNMFLDFFLGKKPIPDGKLKREKKTNMKIIIFHKFNIIFKSFALDHIGYVYISNMNLTFGEKVRDHQWLDLVKHYWAILLVVFIATIIIVLMPIIG